MNWTKVEKHDGGYEAYYLEDVPTFTMSITVKPDKLVFNMSGQANWEIDEDEANEYYADYYRQIREATTVEELMAVARVAMECEIAEYERLIEKAKIALMQPNIINYI